MIINYQVIKTANGQAGYSFTGKGRPLVLIVGYTGTLYHWNRYFIDELAQNFTLYLVDNRKIGLSDSDNEYSMFGLAQDIIDFVEALNLKEPIIFGWSMGGSVTQSIAKLRPDLASGLVLLAAVPNSGYTKPAFIQLLMNSKNLSAEEFRLQLYAIFFSIPPNREIKDIITNNATLIKDYHYRFSAYAKELQNQAITSWSGSNSDILNNIKLPVLVLRARNDMVVGSDAASFLVNNLPNAKLIEYPTGGHFFLHHNPREVACDVANFFSI